MTYSIKNIKNTGQGKLTVDLRNVDFGTFHFKIHNNTNLPEWALNMYPRLRTANLSGKHTQMVLRNFDIRVLKFLDKAITMQKELMNKGINVTLDSLLKNTSGPKHMVKLSKNFHNIMMLYHKPYRMKEERTVEKLRQEARARNRGK